MESPFATSHRRSLLSFPSSASSFATAFAGPRTVSQLPEQRRGYSAYSLDVEASPEEHARVPTAAELSGVTTLPGIPVQPQPSARVPRPSEPRGKTRVVLDLASLRSDRAFFSHRPAVDPLAVWPDKYDPSTDNHAWAACLDWRGTKGYKLGPLEDCGVEPFAFNYAFNALSWAVPSGASGHEVRFNCDRIPDAEAKRRHFYAAFAYAHQYPTYSRLSTDLGIDHVQFCSKVVPTIYSLASNVNFLDRKTRLWDCNHCEHFHERVTSSIDGFPLSVCRSTNQFVQALCYSGKYKESVLKGESAIGLATGFPLDWAGLHVGSKHDITMYRSNHARRAEIFDWEYWIGDKGYIGLAEVICEYKKAKKRSLTPEQESWNRLFQFYRGRNEHAVAEIVQSTKALNTRWRGSFALLSAITRLRAHIVGLQERMRGPRYPCYGPWPMHPDIILA